jgi:hypothetical protein
MLLNGLYLYSSWTTDIHRALDVAARSQTVALKTQDPDDMARAQSMLGMANHLAGNHLVAQTHFEAGLRHSASGSRLRAGHHLYRPTSFLLVGMARSLLYRGVLDQSLEYARLAIEEGEKSGLPTILRFADNLPTNSTDIGACQSRKPFHPDMWPTNIKRSCQRY